MQARDALSPHAAALPTVDRDPFTVLFEHSQQPMLIIGVAGLRVLAANAAALRLYGYERDELLAMTLLGIAVSDGGGDGASPMSMGLGRDGLAAHRKKGGEVIEVEVTGAPMMFDGAPAQLLRLGDLSERRRWRDLLERVERTEVMARLTGMVAHDFGNLLSIINGYADLIAAGLSSDDPLRDDIQEIRAAGGSGVTLTRQLLAFSHKPLAQPQVVNLNMHVAGTRALLGRLLGEQIELVASLDHDGGNIEIDPVHLQQVILNLVINARDAMPAGGRLILETENIALDEASALRHFNLGAGEYVMLAVSDTGQGMDAETQRRAFEPFFTTKGEGRGTGLGLSIVNDIVERHGGGIYFYSIAGVGTTFKIYLPRVFAEAAAAAPLIADFPAGTETVLVVEDEESVREVICHLLASYGYTVLEATSGHEALAICRQGQRPIDLVLTDIMMPQMGGAELAGELRRALPACQLLLMSGYAGDHILRHDDIGGAEAFLQKPILPGPLLYKVRELLDRAATAAGVEGLQEPALRTSRSS